MVNKIAYKPIDLIYLIRLIIFAKYLSTQPMC